MRFNYFDADSITIQADNETNAYGYNQDVWDIYMIAMVETWSGFEVQVNQNFSMKSSSIPNLRE